MTVHQDASVYVASLSPGTEVTHAIGEGRGVYAYLIEGAATFDDQDGRDGRRREGHGPAIAAHHRNATPSELILVDVPMQFEAVGIWRGRV